MSGSFAGQVAVITGGAGGIGQALARILATEGAKVVLADLPGAKLEEAAASNEAFSAFACDTAVLDQVEALADHVWQQHGRCDLLVNNAGIGGVIGKLPEIEMDRARHVFDVNFWGVWHGCRVFGPRMAAQDHLGAIYNTSSENALFCAVPHSAAYIAAKHAVMGMTESFREDMPEHVRVGTIFPGWVQSGMIPKSIRAMAMDADRFAAVIIEQILAGERFAVSHGYNMVHVDEQRDAFAAAFARYAPRYDGDEEFDVRIKLAEVRAARSKG